VINSDLKLSRWSIAAEQLNLPSPYFEILCVLAVQNREVSQNKDAK